MGQPIKSVFKNFIFIVFRGLIEQPRGEGCLVVLRGAIDDMPSAIISDPGELWQITPTKMHTCLNYPLYRQQQSLIHLKKIN